MTEDANEFAGLSRQEESMVKAARAIAAWPREEEPITAVPAIPDPWVLDSRGLWQNRYGRWYFAIKCDQGSTIASGPRPPKIDGFECYFVGHSPSWTHYSYREVLS